MSSRDRRIRELERRLASGDLEAGSELGRELARIGDDGGEVLFAPAKNYNRRGFALHAWEPKTFKLVDKRSATGWLCDGGQPICSSKLCKRFPGSDGMVEVFKARAEWEGSLGSGIVAGGQVAPFGEFCRNCERKLRQGIEPARLLHKRALEQAIEGHALFPDDPVE